MKYFYVALTFILIPAAPAISGEEKAPRPLEIGAAAPDFSLPEPMAKFIA